MIVITRFRIAPERAAGFTARAEEAVAALAARPGFTGSRIGRAADDPELWTVVTEWAGAGHYRRALGDFHVRVTAVPLLSEALDEPSAYEIVSGPT
ncbi:antibiotic biosynthesis monooxygenase [Nocardiopsis coralliicola]